jgi:hypothetical protein
MREFPEVHPVTKKLAAAVIPNGTSGTAAESAEVVTVETADYYIVASKYPDGWLSAYGEFSNAGKAEGLLINMPEGFVFRDNKYGLVATSANSELSGDIDGAKVAEPTTTSFRFITSHITEGMVFEYTDEKFSFVCSGHWK